MMEQEQETTNQQDMGVIISAITLVMYNDLGCDLEPKAIVDGREFPLNLNTLDLFSGFLNGLCQKLNIASVLNERVEVEVNKDRNGKNTA